MNFNDNSISSANYDMQQAEFDWKLQGRIRVIDHGGSLAKQANFTRLMALGAFSVITFDPTSCLHGQEELEEIGELQIIPHALLGDGQSTTLYACIDPSMSGTLPPLEADQLPGDKRTGARVLTRLPIGTLRLDDIEELISVDWLSIDTAHGALEVLENGENTLSETLLIHARVPLLPMRHGETGLAELCHWMNRHGFQCYRITQATLQSHFPNTLSLEKSQATQMAEVDAVFLPTPERIETLAAERLTKLAFLLDAIHQIHDFTYSLLSKIDEDSAYTYLASRGYVSRYDEQPDLFTLTAEYSPAPW